MRTLSDGRGGPVNAGRRSDWGPLRQSLHKGVWPRLDGRRYGGGRRVQTCPASFGFRSVRSRRRLSPDVGFGVCGKRRRQADPNFQLIGRMRAFKRSGEPSWLSGFFQGLSPRAPRVGGLEFQAGAQADHQGVAQGARGIVGVRCAASGADHILKIGLQHPARDDLRGIGGLDQHF